MISIQKTLRISLATAALALWTTFGSLAASATEIEDGEHLSVELRGRPAPEDWPWNFVGRQFAPVVLDRVLAGDSARSLTVSFDAPDLAEDLGLMATNAGHGLEESDSGTVIPLHDASSVELRWSTIGVNDVLLMPEAAAAYEGEHLCWTLQIEARFGLPDMRIGVGFPLHLAFYGSRVYVRADLSDANIRSPFQRGEVTGDGVIDIDDGLVALEYLFSGDDAPTCEAAADTNDDGVVDTTDALKLFQFLFMGGEQPLPPFEIAEYEDTVIDRLGCRPVYGQLVELSDWLPGWSSPITDGEGGGDNPEEPGDGGESGDEGGDDGGDDEDDNAPDEGNKCTEGDEKCIAHFKHTCDGDGNWIKNDPAEQCTSNVGGLDPVETQPAF